MQPEFTVSGRIAKPVHEVFEAVVDPGQLSHFFTTGGAKGRLETGAVVTRDFHDFPGAFPVHVVEVEKDKRIVFRWDGAEDTVEPDAAGARLTTITMTFEQLEDGRTLVNITERGWNSSDPGFKAAFSNCEGWTGMLCAMKLWLEHGFNLRKDFYK